MSDHKYLLTKGEDEDQYKKFAQSGMDLMHTVKIGGKTHRGDIGIPYHATIKLFDPKKDKVDQIHDIASKLHMPPPDAKQVGIEPITLRGRTGYLIHALKLTGPHADQIKQNHEKFKDIGVKFGHEFHPHISLDQETWSKIKESGARTAHEAGIEFGHAVLMAGPKTVSQYPHTEQAPKFKMAKSEEELEKSAKDLASMIGVSAALALGSPTMESSASLPPANHIQHVAAKKAGNGYSTDRMLRTIASVESSDGKNVNHKPVAGGMHHGERAFGKYALMPNTIRETIKINSDLKNKYKKALFLQGDDMNHFMQDNPGLEDVIAHKHLERLEHHFGQDPDKIGYGWNQGIRGTYKAIKDKKNISEHPYTQKIKTYYAHKG